MLSGFFTKCQCWEPECGIRSEKFEKDQKRGEGENWRGGMLPAHKDAGTRLAHMKPAGVGIVFQREDAHDHQGLVVDSLAPGGPADRSKLVESGNRLVMINGKSIKGLDARGIARLILGPLGSHVELVFETNVMGPPQRKTVTLTRGVQLTATH
eukprot:CAMPEP_0179406542 /NCGR_PEP_ID=MMETSP0799-20121207/951_1 /TAXON_ID=46947 /ORGANISM="Geminigera cryophila, Strain CCMP2564" /LENGTH=153 /DNA_ID=CAMNT_0021177615 /DNA_START=144 /DNA_END=605 /DNA_ORIENTATION=-